jgi:hypothetical protein
MLGTSHVRPVSAADRRPIGPKSGRLWPALCAAVLVLSACGGGGGGSGGTGTTEPSFKSPTVTPATAHWGTSGAQFVVSGGAHLEGSSFTARLGETACASATVDDADPTKLKVVCDIPSGGPSSRLSLEILLDGKKVSGTDMELYVALDWPSATGPASFSSAKASSTATWWQKSAPIRVTGGVNLPGHALTAVMDGLPCGTIGVSSEDAGTLELTCSTRPGGPGTKAKLAIQENGVTLPGGEVELELAACADPGAPTSGVLPPQLCNAPAGTTAAVSAGLEGGWWDGTTKTLVLFAPNGQFIGYGGLGEEYWGGQWSASSSTWSPSSAEYFGVLDPEPFTAVGTVTPFTSVSNPSVDAYLEMNALPVSQSGAPGTAGVAGTWGFSTADLTLTVDSLGAFTGKTSGSTYGTCTLYGSVTVIAPPKDMLSIALTAAGGTGCKLWQSNQLTGLGYIDVINLGTTASPRYEYYLALILRSAGHFYMSGTALRQ